MSTVVRILNDLIRYFDGKDVGKLSNDNHMKFQMSIFELINLDYNQKLTEAKEMIICDYEQRLKDSKENFLSEKSQLNLDLKQTRDELAKTRDKLADTKARLDMKSEFLEKNEKELSALRSHLEQVKTAHVKTSTTLENTLQRKDMELQKIKALLESCENVLKNKTSTLEQTEVALRDKNSELKKALEKLAEEKRAYSEQQKKLGEIFDRLEISCKKDERASKAFKPHLEILRLIYGCPSMSVFLEKKNLSPSFEEDDFDNLVRFISEVGEETSFASTLRAALKDAKNAGKEPLTPVELQLIGKLNEYYKNKFSISHDILEIFPDVSLNNESMAFNAGKMRDFKDESNPDPAVRKVTAVCVPAVMKKEKENLIVRHALVLGH